MEFLLLIHVDENLKRTPAEQEAMHAEYGAYSKELVAAGVMLGGEPLMHSSKGAKVSVREGKTRIVDGPFAEAKEALGGYYKVNVPALADAVKWAAKCPGAKHGTMEVREVMPFARP